jgi:putative tricarboxylic transport membrane protein
VTGEREAAGKDWAGALASAFFAGVGIYVFVASFAMSPMAAMFPRTIGAVLAGLALLQIAAALTGRSARSVEAGGSLTEQTEGLGRRLSLLGCMIGWAVLFPVVGMLVTSLAACVILMFTAQFGRLSPQRLAVYLGTLLAMVVLFYLLMTRVLNIPMPRGLLI